MNINIRRSTVRRGLPVLLCGLWVASAANAQREVERQAPEPRAQAQEPAWDLSQGISPEVTPGPIIESADDAPDFRPFIEVDAPEGTDRAPSMLPTGDPYVLSFPGGDFKPERGVDPRLRAQSGETAYGYVMVEGRMAAKGRRAALERLGCKILGVHTWQSWVVQFPRANADLIANLDFVRWVGMAQVEQKLEPELAARFAAAADADYVQVDISTFVTDLGPASRRVTDAGPSTSRAADAPVEQAVTKTIPNGPFHRALVAAGMQFESYTDVDNVHVFHGRLRKADLDKVLAMPFVSFVEERPQHTLAHDQSMSMTHQDLIRKTWSGRGVPVGLIDTGVHYINGLNHRDTSPYMWGWSNVSGGSPYDDGHGHGTHVAGTIFGRGIQDKRYTGGLPKTATDGTDRFLVGRYFNSAGAAQGNVANLYNALRQSVTSGGKTTPRAYAINNSWGSYRSTGYNGADSGSRTVDAYVWTYRQAYVFAAGNEGASAYIRSPGTAKNAITVGGTDDTTRSGRKPGDFYTGSSGRGTTDLRRKPEILAPASIVTSLRTKSRTAYTNKSGTSMAAPHITAAAGSMVQMRKDLFNYVPSRLKAHMLAATEYLGSPGGSSGWFGTRGGFGQLDARKLPGSAKTTWFNVGNVTSSTNGATWVTNVTIPTNAENLKFIGTWFEPAASSAATRAKVNDVRFMLDVAPFNSPASPGTGDISVSSSRDTVLSFARGGSAARALRGKQVRIWIWGRTVTTTIRPAWTLMIDRDIPSSSSTLAVTAPTIVRPSTSLNVGAYLTANSNVSDFDSAHLQLVASGFTFQSMKRTTLDNILQTYSGSFPSSPYPSLTGGMTVGTGHSRRVDWTLRAPATSGTYTLRATSNARPTSTKTTSRSICVDGLAPNTVASLRSLSHPVNAWSRSTLLRMSWAATADNGCAGMLGYATRTNLGAAATPTVRNLGNVTTQNVSVSSNTRPYYFTARAVDRISNFSSRTSVAGPFYVDNIAPVLSNVVINGGASATNSRNVSVRVSATDSHSGLLSVRLSANGSTWSPWRTIAASYAFDLASYGGNTAQGSKLVYAQVRDKAGNLSRILRDAIVYDSLPPVITLVQLANGAAATTSLNTTVRVTGNGGPTQMRFSSNNATWSPWRTYSSSALAYNLSSYGGTTAFGTKACYAQLRDAVGNASSVVRDTINYVAVPVLSGVSPSAVNVVNKTRVRLTGTSLSTVTGIRFGSTTITSRDNQDWANGYFRPVSDSAIDLFVPQGQAPGDYQVRAFNASATSGTVTVRVSHNATRFAGSPERIKRGRVLDVKVHRGAQPATAISILMISVSGLPLNLPGLVNLGHGGNATTIIDPSLAVLAVGAHDPTTRVASFAVPTTSSLPAVRLYFETLLLDTLNPSARPIPSSGATSTQLF